MRHLVPLALFFVVSVAVAAPLVIVNGEPATISVAEVDGKAFVDIVALMQLLGGKATYDAAAGKLYINSTAGGEGGGAAPATLADFGTPQLPGETGEIGQVYKLRNGSPLLFRLNSAEYSVEQLRFGSGLVTPKAAEKLLVLHFSVQNPQNVELLFRFDSLKFTVVDEMNVNHEAETRVGDEQTRGDLNMRLKPAQRIEGYVCAVVPAKGVIPKLMVMPPGADDGPILRYDLRDRVTAFAAPIADPADPSGATALERVPAQVGTPYALRYYDVTVEKCETTTTGPNGAAGPNGETYLVITMLCRNETAIDMTLRFDSFVTTLTDADGVQLKRHNDLLAATSNTSFNQRVASGSETRVRCFFTVPKDVKPKTLAIKEADSRTYEYDVSQ